MAAERDLSPPERYALVKANVDEIPVVQLGITLCDWFGNVPTFADGDGRQHEVAWEVTFSDFDVHRHRHAPESVAFLQSRGLDFDHARARGVSSAAFAAMLAAVLSSPAWRLEEVTWAAFGGAHDFAYLVKMLAGGRPLPGTWHEFAALAGDLLGGRVFDAKYMAEHCERTDLSGGGLRGVAASLRVQQDLPERPEGRTVMAALAVKASSMACTPDGKGVLRSHHHQKRPPFAII
jgi:CCR4-NOT transcription complex subunit 7/8